MKNNLSLQADYKARTIILETELRRLQHIVELDTILFQIGRNGQSVLEVLHFNGPVMCLEKETCKLVLQHKLIEETDEASYSPNDAFVKLTDLGKEAVIRFRTARGVEV